MSRDEAALHALAYGVLSEADSLDLERLKEQIQRESGFFCAGYKEKCLRRRIAIRMRARGVHRYPDYAALLREDPEEYERLFAALTIHVSKFFRNFEVWEVVRREVIPALFALDDPVIRVWSAGSAAGEEAYTVAILLQEYAADHGLTRQLGRFEIVGSDIDPEILEAARRAEYGDMALVETPPEIITRWFISDRKHQLRDEIRRMVRFTHLDLLTDPFPEGQHLVFCRNVTIYFERSIQADLLTRFHESLSPGGFLVLGKVETLLGPISRSFRSLSNPDRVFQRL